MSSEADPDEVETRLRAVERRLRRDKLGLEKLNPLTHVDAYAAALERVADLEAERRDLKHALRAVAGPPSGAPSEAEDDETSDETTDDDVSQGDDVVDLRDRS